MREHWGRKLWKWEIIDKREKLEWERANESGWKRDKDRENGKGNLMKEKGRKRVER